VYNYTNSNYNRASQAKGEFMTDYQHMYEILFNAITDTITQLQNAQESACGTSTPLAPHS